MIICEASTSHRTFDKDYSNESQLQENFNFKNHTSQNLYEKLKQNNSSINKQIFKYFIIKKLCRNNKTSKFKFSDSIKQTCTQPKRIRFNRWSQHSIVQNLFRSIIEKCLHFKTLHNYFCVTLLKIFIFFLMLIRVETQTFRNVNLGFPEAWDGDKYDKLHCPAKNIPKFIGWFHLC